MLYDFKAPKTEGEEEEEAEAPELNPVGYVPNLLAESRIYQWAGIGFSEQETYLIQKSLKDLSTTSQATQLKFWGKIHGTEKDYFIAEGVLEGEDEVPEGEEEVEKPKDFEPRGTGVNKFCYWVTSNPVNVAWVKLPDITPDEIKASRVIKVSFSGDLERPIHTNPFFFGTEKIYLRSQIARISHSTTLAAKGVWKVGEPEDEGVPSREIEENVPEDAEAPVWPSTKQMADPSMWVHYQPALLKCARTTHMEEEPPEDAPEELTAEVMMA